MTQSSPRGGMMTFALEQLDPAADLGPVLSRDYIANNILHAADQSCARVLVNDVAANDTYIVDNVDQYSTGIISDVLWRPVTAYGPFSFTTRDTAGTRAGYRIRAALFACAASGSPKAVEFAVQVIPYGPSIERVTVRELLNGTNAILFQATSSTSPIDLTPTAEDTCIVDPSTIWTEPFSQPVAPGSATPITVAVPQVMVRVLARGTTEGLLYGAHIAEVF